MALDEPKEQSDPSEMPPRRHYQKPVILWEEKLDVRKTLAVACAKIAGRGGICNAAPTS